MIYVGIDPGTSGALAVIIRDEYGDTISIYPYDEDKYDDVLSLICKEVTLCCVEEVHSMPKQGVASTFTFGKNYGVILGMLKSYKVPYLLVKPQIWKKEFGLIKADKAKSIEVAKHRFPNVSFKKTERCTTNHDGMAEALLIAEYASLKNKKEN